jgi:hypothetical protein
VVSRDLEQQVYDDVGFFTRAGVANRNSPPSTV